MVSSPMCFCTHRSSSSSSLMKMPRYSTEGQSAFSKSSGRIISSFSFTGTSAQKYQGETPSMPQNS